MNYKCERCGKQTRGIMSRVNTITGKLMHYCGKCTHEEFAERMEHEENCKEAEKPWEPPENWKPTFGYLK